jgi:hypothetical protein
MEIEVPHTSLKWILSVLFIKIFIQPQQPIRTLTRINNPKMVMRAVRAFAVTPASTFSGLLKSAIMLGKLHCSANVGGCNSQSMERRQMTAEVGGCVVIEWSLSWET